MKKLIQIVRDNCEFTKEEIEQEKLITDLSNAFVKTLTEDQVTKFVDFLIARDKLEGIKINNHIVTTHKICKEVFKLR